MDCDSFTKDVVADLEDNTHFFYIRAQRSANLYSMVSDTDI